MPIREFARLARISVDTARRCVIGTHPKLPPLPAKRMPNGQLYITGADATEWISSLDDA